MNLYQEILLLIAGIAAGYINVLAGGGSLLTVPLMVLMGVPAPIANGTNRIAVLAQSISSTWVFIRKGVSELKLTASLALFTLPGAWVGAQLGLQLDGVLFNRLLAAIMALVMVLMLFEKKLTIADQGGGAPRRLFLTHALMLIVGFYGGLLQVGIGFLIMAILHRVMGLNLVRVNIHKVFLVLPLTLLSLYVYASGVGVLWRAGVFLALGMAFGGWLGAHMMIQKGERLIKAVVNLALVALIVKLLFFSS